MRQVIAITGASSGIGLALVRELAQPGNHLILLARRTAILERLATEARESGARATVHTIDFQEPNAWQKAYGTLTANGLNIETLYHCAVRISGGAVHHTRPEDWQEIYRVNLLSTTAILATLYPAMVQRGHGTIVLFSSLTSLAGIPMAAPYGATKTAILGIWKSLQAEASRTGVSVHLVSPSFIDTPLFENFILRKVTSQQMRQSTLATRIPITQPSVAAQKIIAGVAKGKKYLIFPFSMAICAFFVRRIPAIGRHIVKQSNRAAGIEK